MGYSVTEPLEGASTGASHTEHRMIVVGLLPVDGPMAGLIKATGADGQTPVPPELAQSLLGLLAREGPVAYPRSPRIATLTFREQQVCERIREGLSNKQIASRLGIAIHTVKSHVHNVLEKLGLERRGQIGAATGGWPTAVS
jgi:DNA-binding NarL/FixJ family response regulator